jgi:ubiquitin carboxyl-terminal hydrolase 5/13
MSQMAKVGVALVDGRTGDAPAGPAAAATESLVADGPVDPAGAAAGAAPAAAASPGAGQADALAVKPQAFKHLVGRGHPEFSSNRQQVLRQRIASQDHVVQLNIDDMGAG